MKKFFAIFISVLILSFSFTPLFAIEYAADFLEPGNPGGLGTCDISTTPCSSDLDCAGGLLSCLNPSLKTFDDEWTAAENEEVYMDIWLKDCPESILTAGFGIAYDPAEVTIVRVDAYDGVDLPGPWDDGFTNSDRRGERGRWFFALGQFSCVEPDSEGDIILGRVHFHAEADGNPSIGIFPLDDSFDTVVGCSTPVTYDSQIPDKVLNEFSTFLCSFSIDPSEGTVLPGESIQFWVDTFGVCNDPCYTWEIFWMGSPGSIIDSNGLYTAGADAGYDTVEVTDFCNDELSDRANVRVEESTTTTSVSQTTSTTTTIPDTTTTTLPQTTSTTTIFMPGVEEQYKFERMWPTLSQPQYFHGISGIAIDNNGYVYVSDKEMNHIQKFSTSGQFVTKWGSYGDGEGEFNLPGSIAVDNNGFVYVFDYLNGRIQKFTSNGQFLREWGDGRSENLAYRFASLDLAVDSEGYVYAADQRRSCVKKFTADGQFVTEWGSENSYDDIFEPLGLVIDKDDFVYVSSTFSVFKFTPDGEFVKQWSLNAVCDSMGNMAIDSNGFIYVQGSLGIQKFTTDGYLVDQWGNFGRNDGEFYEPGCIAIDNNDFLYVCEKGEHFTPRIQKFTTDGQFIDKWVSHGHGEGEFHAPSGMVIDSDGVVYVEDGLNGRIQKFTPNGQFIDQWESSDHLEDIDSNNLLYFLSYISDNQFILKKLTPDGQVVDQWLPWEQGDGPGEFNNPVALAVDGEGFVYVADNNYWYPDDPYINFRVQKFTPDGQFVTTWGNRGSGEGEILDIQDIAVDSNDFVYVADLNYRIQKFTSDGQFVTSWNIVGEGQWPYIQKIAVDKSGFVYVGVGLELDDRIPQLIEYSVQKFTPDGQFVTQWGSYGIGPGQMYEIGDIAEGIDERIYLTDYGNNRVQVFKKRDVLSNPKAIIVAGRASSGDNLWDVTQMLTNYAYRTLTYQGFTKDDIFYLTSDTDLDLDGNGVFDEVTGYSDDVDELPTNANLQSAITDWAIQEGAESLVVYLNDHGGDDTFRINENEILSASDLASWLDELQASIPGSITVIYEACESGSFMDELEDDDRVIITSTLPGEQAQFSTNGTISFSYFFWSNIFNGLTIDESFIGASQAVNLNFSAQTPQLEGDPGQLYIGNGVTGMLGDAPVIGEVSPAVEIHLENSSALYADNVTDPDGIARVWAVIWPPDYDPGPADTPLLDLPTVELLPSGTEGRFEGIFNEFNASGVYRIAIYAMDRIGNVSLPEFTTVSKSVSRRALIVAGGEGPYINREIIEYTAELAYNTLISQFYSSENIHLMSVTTFIEDIITYLPTLTNLDNYLETLAVDENIENLDLTIYLVGASENGDFILNDNPDAYEILTSSQFDEWLDNLQDIKPGRVTVISDFDRSGTFMQEQDLQEERQRITITSTGETSEAYFNTQGDISFSSFLLKQLASGARMGDAFTYAKKAISYCSRTTDVSFSCYRPQNPLIDADGNGNPNEPSDYEIAQKFRLGNGILYGNDPPTIGSVSLEQGAGVVTIRAEEITATVPIERVWAVIRPLRYCPGYSEGEVQAFNEIELHDPDGDGTYEGTCPDASFTYKVTVYAMSYDDNGEPIISQPVETKIYREEGGDIYEPDDVSSEAQVIVVNHPTPQPHTFHYEGDEDWVKFYGMVKDADDPYTIKTSNLGDNCPVIELYDAGDLTTPIAVASDPPSGDEVWIDFRCTREGIYYVRVLWGGCEWVEGNMHYDLKVDDNNFGLTAIVRGKVRDRVSGRGIDGAVIRSSGVGATISTHGEYILSEIPGSWTLRARKSGYTTAVTGIKIDSQDQQVRKDVRMTPRSSPCSEDADCDDGNYCNGIEICVDEKCQPGVDPCQDDGLYCNGEEVGCDEEDDICDHSGSPCPGHRACVEESDECVDKECNSDEECDDNQFCNGEETCGDGFCQQGIVPCTDPTPACDEEGDICIERSTIQLLPNPCLQSHWMPLLMILRIVGTNTHFDTSSLVTFDPSGVVMALPILGDSTHLFMIGLMMPSWLAPVQSVEVSVSTGSEAISERLNIDSLPFMMDVQKGTD